MSAEALASLYHFTMIVGGGFLLFSFIFGGDHHHLLGDIGGLGDGIENLLGDIGIHFDGDNDLSPVLNPINLRNILAFLAAFGAFGTLSVQNGATPESVFGLSIILAILAMLVVWAFSIMLFSQTSNSAISEEDFINQPAEVTLTILPNSVGEVSLSIGGQFKSLPARSLEGIEFHRGDKVVVRTYQGGVAEVIAQYETPQWELPKTTKG